MLSNRITNYEQVSSFHALNFHEFDHQVEIVMSPLFRFKTPLGLGLGIHCLGF